MITVRHGDNVHRVPCGRCAFCLSNKRSSWMFRIYYEMRSQLYPGHFLTLTYDEKHVRRVGAGRLSLRFRDVQLYIKRFRKAKYYVKYVCVGEYGSETQRPHYHMLLWTDAPVQFIQDNWKSSKDDSRLGVVHFGRLTMASAMYTMKYIIQPKVRDMDFNIPISERREKTRAQFSKGLGISYLTAAVYDYHTEDYDNPVMFSVVDGRKVALPRYYKSKIFTNYQLKKEGSKTKWESIRRRRRYMRELIMQGIVNTKVYIKQLRTEQAARIISSTKYSQSL